MTATRDGDGAHEPGARDEDQQERRATVRLVHYWSSLRRNHALPAFVDFDPHRNPVPWDNCLLAACRSPREVVYEHVGAGLAAIDHDAGTATPESLPFVREVTRLLPMVLRTGDVQHVADSYRRAPGGTVLYRAVLLPFRGTREEWSYVLGAATFRIEEQVRPAISPGKSRTEQPSGGAVAAPPTGD